MFTEMPAEFVGSNRVADFQCERGQVTVTAFAANSVDVTGGLERRQVEIEIGDDWVSVPLADVDRVIDAMREAQVAAETLRDLG